MDRSSTAAKPGSAPKSVGPRRTRGEAGWARATSEQEPTPAPSMAGVPHLLAQQGPLAEQRFAI
ncbi:MAG: hypothetical protein P8129_23510, partial [Anaerolineae bacterium]